MSSDPKTPKKKIYRGPAHPKAALAVSPFIPSPGIFLIFKEDKNNFILKYIKAPKLLGKF